MGEDTDETSGSSVLIDDSMDGVITLDEMPSTSGTGSSNSRTCKNTGGKGVCSDFGNLVCSWVSSTTQVFCELGMYTIVSAECVERNAFDEGQKIALTVCSNCSNLRLLEYRTKKCKVPRSKKMAVYAENDFLLLDKLRRTSSIFDISVQPQDNLLVLKICLRKVALRDASIYGIHGSAQRDEIVWVMSYFFPKLVPPPESARAWEKEDCAWFLRKITEERKPVERWRLNTESIVPVLRPYQEDATRFMISRELYPSIESPLDKNYVQVPTQPSFLFYASTAGISVDTVANFRCNPGGVLADEMGLGKTVEVIALAMTHQRGSKLELETVPPSKPDVVKMIVDELVSTVVAGLETQSVPIQGEKSSGRVMYFSETEATEIRKKKKSPKGEKPPLTVTCTCCSLVCRQDRVFWDRFPSCTLEFKCPDCIFESGSCVPIGTTLIIAPGTICRQWYEELKRHVREDVRVDLYRGVAVEGYKHPAYLAYQHFVICAFETLRSEIHFTEGARKDRRTLRRKRTLYAPSPLTSVEWWRICLDEAQVVEGASGSAYEMCRKLYAVNRWCVTGTPINESLISLYGFISFIGTEPFCYRSWFHHALWVPHTRGDSSYLVKLFRQLLWRNTKDHVVDQLDSPARAKDLTVLHLSPFEEQLYRGLFNGRIGDKTNALRASLPPVFLDTCLSDLHGALFERVMEPLQNMRSFIVLPNLQFSRMRHDLSSKEQLQEELFKRTTVEIEKAQRDLMFYYNGIAGLYWLLEQYFDVAEYYELAVSSVDVLNVENENLNLTDQRGPYRKLKADRLQLIHALNGAHDLYGTHGVCRERFDLESVKKRIKETVDEHMVQPVTVLKTARDKMALLLRENADKWKDMGSMIGWMCVAARSASDAQVQHLFVDSIRAALDVHNRAEFKGRDITGLNYVAISRWEELIAYFVVVRDLTEKFAKPTFLSEAGSTLDDIISCHFSPKDGRRKECILCEYDIQLRNFESLLYFGINNVNKKRSFEKTKDEEEEDRLKLEKGDKGHKKVSTLEIIMRVFRQSITRRPDLISKDVVELASESLSFIDLLKEFLQSAKTLMLSYYDYAARSDELRQCKIRLSHFDSVDTAGRSGVPGTAFSFLYTRGSERQEIGYYEYLLERAKGRRAILLSRLRYLSKLRNETTMDCPICYDRFLGTWLVFPCAHCICSSCYDGLARGRFRERIRCPVCRFETDTYAITFVQNASPSDEHHYLDSPSAVLKSEASVKLNAIARRILSIGERDPFGKILLFTSLVNIIPLICRHLTANEIKYRNFASGNKEKMLMEFRTDPAIQVLVIPISLGARGLNLTVANHIIFVEPQLDAAQLAQAIGRIDRIGQTREMMVHHFVMYGTVEEQIFNKVLDPKSEEWTVRSLMNLITTEHGSET